MIFFGPEWANAQTDCFECLQVVMVDFFMADQLCSQVPQLVSSRIPESI